MDSYTYEGILSDLDEISNSVAAYRIHEKIRNLVEHDIPLILKEIVRLQEMESLVYRLMYTNLDEKESEVVQQELEQLFRDQIEWSEESEEEETETTE